MLERSSAANYASPIYGVATDGRTALAAEEASANMMKISHSLTAGSNLRSAADGEFSRAHLHAVHFLSHTDAHQ